ncbi:signal peptidase I [Macrococcoides caseolyticum]|uniref:signal peptidase I n=1 Tax=Macrococcoides caseolyticum TaxID=69966 RepID=UPI001F41665D|nr:signal peptidase I [Macrococcus caseolyticus]MCE4956811.1 signal peptidase I [Macrococcus caseolyticus]
MNKELKEWIISIVIAVVLVLVVRTFFFSQYQISGDSMAPTFENKERVIINKMSTWTNQLHHGDIIVFHANEEKDYIKRLIGLPGDKVEYKNDILYINGKAIKENYLISNKQLSGPNQLTEDFSVKMLANSGGSDVIPDGKFLVLGDNRAISLDSRRQEVGLIDSKSVVGKVSLRFWPFSAFETKFFEEDFNEVNK